MISSFSCSHLSFSPFNRQTSLSISISHSIFLSNHAFLLKSFSQLTTLNVHFKQISFFMSTILHFNAPKSVRGYQELDSTIWCLCYKTSKLGKNVEKEGIGPDKISRK